MAKRSDLAPKSGRTAWLTTADLAVDYGRSERTVRNWINHGCKVQAPAGTAYVRLKAVRLGRSLQIHPDWLAAFESTVRRLRTATCLDDVEDEHGLILDRTD
jgi:hypothetical protein